MKNNVGTEKELIIEKTQESKYEKWCCIISLEDLFQALYEFEINNLRGIKFFEIDTEKYQLEGWRGVPEKCYDTGRSVYYNGNCLAVLDDDSHFIFKNIRICEKTADVYRLPVYQNELHVTEPDHVLYEKLKTDPVLFDCDTLQRDSSAVSEQILYEHEKAEQSIIYTGPFRWIVLHNGVIIRRGIPTSISKKSKELVGEKNCISLNMSAPLAKNYLDLYKKYGPIFLMDNSLSVSINDFPELKRVALVSDTMKERLRKMVDNNDDYFILQGSDPAEKGSCCPNTLVSELNQLIQSKLMSSWTSSKGGSTSCAMTVYSFSGELSLNNDSSPSFTKNEFLRLSIRKYL